MKNSAAMPPGTTASQIRPASPVELQEAVLQSPRIIVRGGGTLSNLTKPDHETTVIDLSALNGIVEYEPGEFTFTARAGTALATLRAALAGNGQYLPFDPPLVDAGATLGGTVAAGLSGSGRHRYGGVRDFLIGVRFVDGCGRLIRGGGKVVKNAAGFDLPKLMVGSLGAFGILTELSFKVFPEPPAYATIVADHPSLSAALAAVKELLAQPIDLEAIDLLATATGSIQTLARLGGFAATLPLRLERANKLLNGQVISGDDDATMWRQATEFGWTPQEYGLAKCAVSINRLPSLDTALHAAGVLRRYSAAGQLAWLAWQGSHAPLHALLQEQGLQALALRAAPETPLYLGTHPASPFAARIKAVLDPDNRFRGI
jgi:glycolate oxidase FAD binding subunit